MKMLRNALVCGLLLAGILLILQLTYLANRIEESFNQADSQFYYQNLALIRVEQRVGRSFEVSAMQVALARRDLNEIAGEVLKELHAHLSLANESLEKTAYSVSGSAVSIADSTSQIAGGAAQIESQISGALELSFDCVHQTRDSDGALIFEGNPDCFHNRFVGAARGIEQAAKAWGDAAPRQAGAATASLESVETITGDLAKRPPLWLRILKWMRWLRP